MKAAGYILSVYLVLLSVIPCCAFDDCSGDKAQTRQAAGHNAGDKDDCGGCTPFFNCEGCASVAVYTPVPGYTTCPPVLNRIYAEFIPPSTADAHYDFWQPPRVEANC